MLYPQQSEKDSNAQTMPQGIIHLIISNFLIRFCFCVLSPPLSSRLSSKRDGPRHPGAADRSQTVAALRLG